MCHSIRCKLTIHKEQELLKGVQEGDIGAFGLLYEAYFEPLCNFAFLFTGERELAIDLVSDLFADLWFKAGKIRVRTSLKSYLYKSTRNTVISYYRKSRPLGSLDESPGVEREHPLDRVLEHNPETLLLKKEFSNRVRALLETLPPKAAMVLRLKKLDGLSYREISEILGISERTVENHIAAAIRKLRDLIKDNPELGDYLKKAD